MASTSVAVARTAVDSVVTVHPPASSFAALLRRSRFATFDPKIRQTYSTPPSHAARGSWGLKRPLALRRRNAFISLSAPFEDRAQFIEWDKAEDEVRFIRRFEEMQVRPRMVHRTPWSRTVGLKNSTNWLIDSEFAHRHEGPEAEEPNALLLAQEIDPEEAEKIQKSRNARSALQKNEHIDASLSDLGNSGQGGYGKRRAITTTATSHKRVSPNVDAMLPHEFEAYVRRIRLLRPQFKEFLQSQVVEGKRTLEKLTKDLQAVEREAATDQRKKLDIANLRSAIAKARRDALHPSTNLYQIVQMPNVSYHRRFIEACAESQFADISNSNGVVIEQRPHPVGGLLYSHPSLLHSQIFSSPQPGIILQTLPEQSGKQGSTYVASFGGFTPTVVEQHRGDKIPLLNHHSSEGIRRENIKRSVAKMRLHPGSVGVEQPPKSVADDPSLTTGLKDVKISSQAMVAGSRVMFSQSNPYKPGSMEYVALVPVKDKGAASKGPILSSIARNARRAQVDVRTNTRGNFARWRKNQPPVSSANLFKTLTDLTKFGNDAEGN
ncbi:hypothetical protein D9757_005114 [Collybiopsis confluens]|uniref:Uncharacterized protein n=1 Tax=Collybiopsis confluens TaxID=2823264 RepID=A0A8H5HT17_9AGAR|nr:hypothetical protein D9757_005114 [Collybiopsis confluens]